MADPWAVQSIEADDPWAVQAVEPVRAKPASKPKRSAVDTARGLVANLNRGMAIGDELTAGANVLGGLITGRHRFGADKPGNVIANNLNMLSDAYRAELAGQRASEDRGMSENRLAANLARGSGMAITSAIPAGNAASVYAQGSKAVNALRGASTAGLVGAGYAAADAGTMRERLRSASETARNPLVLGLGAAGGALATPRTAKPKPKISDDVITLREKGVPLTPGLAKGGVARAAEDALTSTPILGTAIQEARQGGLEAYNRAWGDDALKEIGETLPDNIAAGHDTVAYVQKRFGQAYDRIIPGRTIAADNEFKANIAQRLGDLAQDMTEPARQRLAQILDQRVTQRVGPNQAVDGKQFQSIMSQLSTLKNRFSGSQDEAQRAIAEGIEIMQDEMRAAAARQDPVFAEAKAAADRGYAMFKRLQGAAGSLGAEGGVATAAQFGGAVRRADKSLDKGRFAAGEAFGQNLADAGKAVLPSKTPDSGTATRGAWGMMASAPGAIIAGGAAGGPVGAAGVAAGYGATLGALKAGSKAYSPEAISAFNRALDGRISAQQQARAVAELRALAARDPRAVDLYREAMVRLTRSAGTAQQRQPSVEVSIEGRPDLGVGRAYGPAGQ